MTGACDKRPRRSSRAIVDRAGALVERYAYDPYGRPLIRESAGRGDFDSDTDMDSNDLFRLGLVIAGSVWDPRGDIDDDGDVDSTDNTRYALKDNNWPPQSTSLTVAQAFSDVGNPFMFQGRPHFALDTQASDTAGKLMLNDHRARFNDPVIGRWLTRDPLFYSPTTLVLRSGSALHPILAERSTSHPEVVSRMPTRLPDSADATVSYLFEKGNSLSYSDPSGLVINCNQNTCDCQQHCAWEAHKAIKPGGSCDKVCAPGTKTSCCRIAVKTGLEACLEACIASGDENASGPWIAFNAAIKATLKACR